MFCVIYLQSDAKLLEIFSQSFYSTLYIHIYSCQNHNHVPESVKKWTWFVSLPPKSEGSLIKACLSVKGEGGNSSSSVEKSQKLLEEDQMKVEYVWSVSAVQRRSLTSACQFPVCRQGARV